MSDDIRPRRSVLYTPGSNVRALEKARGLAVDGVIMDLEDAVAPDGKTAARTNVMAAVQAGGYGYREVVVRINGLDTPWGADDAATIARTRADAVLIPKIDSAGQLQEAIRFLKAAGASDRLQYWVMAETPAGILQITEIAGADPDLAVIVMGTADLASALRIASDPARHGLLPALGQCVLAARARGVDILDGVHEGLADDSAFRASCVQGKTLGFDGKTLIHPRQIPAANEIFGVTEDGLARAAEIIAAWEVAAAGGQGIAVLNGRMIEKLHADEAHRVLAMNAAIAARDAGS